MAVNKVKPNTKKKVTNNSNSRASILKLAVKNKVTYNQRILAALYTLCRRKHKFKVGIYGSTLTSYLKKFTNNRLDTHTRISDPAMKRAKRELEENGLVELENGYFKLAESAREGIVKNRQEKNDSDDDEAATVTWFKSTFPHSLSPRSKTPVHNLPPKSAAIIKKRKSLPKKRVASTSLSSEESSADERVIPKKSKAKRGKKFRKIEKEARGDDSESDLSELESSNDEKENDRSKKSLAKKEVEEEEEEEEQVNLKKNIVILTQGFQKLQEINQAYKSRLEKYEVVLEDEDGNPLSPVIRAEDEDLGGMDDMMFDDQDDSGFFQLDDAASNADTEVSQSEKIVAFLEPPILEKHDEIDGFDAEFPELPIECETTGLSKAQLQIYNKELIPTRSFTSNHIPSPASSYVGVSRSNDGNFTEDEDNALYGGTDTSLTKQHSKSKEVNSLQTPAVRSSPSRSTTGNTESSRFATASQQPRSSSVERASDDPNQELVNEIESLKDSLKSVEVEREQEKEKFIEMKSGLESELEGITKQYQDFVETSQNKIQSLEATIVDIEASSQQVERNLEISEEETQILKSRIEDCEANLKEARDEIEIISAELKNAQNQIEISQTQHPDQLQSKQEAILTSEARIIDLEKQLATTITNMSVTPSVDASVHTGEDPAFEVLRAELTLEREVAVDKIAQELNLANESFANLQIKYTAVESVNESLQDMIEKEGERWNRSKLEYDRREKEFKEVLAIEKEKMVHAEDQIQILNKSLEDARASRILDSTERDTLLSQVQSIEIEKIEISAMLSNVQAELNEISMQSIELAAQNTSMIESLRTEQRSISQNFSTFVQSLATLSSRYITDFSHDDPQSSLINLFTKLATTDDTLKALSTSIMSILSTRHDNNENDQTVSQLGDDLTTDLRKIKSRLSAYLEEVNKSEKALEEVTAQLDSRNVLIRRIVSKTGELEQLCDSSRTEINNEDAIFDVIEVVKGKISELEAKLVNSSKTLEILEEEKKIASLEINKNMNRLVEVEKEYSTYRRKSFEAYKSQGERMGWNSELEKVEAGVEDVQQEGAVIAVDLS